jgi:hypothetical protein
MKKIIFSAISERINQIIDPPTASVRVVPDWYRKMSPRIENKNINHVLPDGQSNFTIKSCLPVFDSIACGYMVTLPCDVQFVDPEEYGHRVIWDVSWQVISQHSENQIKFLSIPIEYDRSPLKWNGVWNIKTPPGYSLLYTHPFYRYDLPFISTTGIVDSDVYDTAVNIPFFIKKDFYGLIPMGTPIAQIIPIKREKWKSQIQESKLDHNNRLDNVHLKLKKSYKNRWWQKKEYS